MTRTRQRVATFSIVGCDLERREWGVAVQSKFLAVGAVVPVAEAEVGAVATQALANMRYRGQALGLFRQGVSAQQAIAELVAADAGRDERQLGVVDAQGRGATFTGGRCFEWAGGRAGDGYAAQGNILQSAATVDALADTFEQGAALPLAERLLEALAAGQRAGGDRRGQQSAALVVARRDGGYGGTSDVAVDLRVDDHAAPIEELRRLYALHQLYFGSTPRQRWLQVTPELRQEVEELLAELGFAGEPAAAMRAWTGSQNLEDRYEGLEWLDPVVLRELRSASAAGSGGG